MRPQKAGAAVLFSGKNLHEGLPVTSGVRYILTGFCEYVNEIDPDNKTSPHSLFLRDYDSKYDGYAALGGVHTGDIIKGIYDANGALHCANKDENMISVLKRIRHKNYECESTDIDSPDNLRTSDSIVKKMPQQCSLLVERLISTEYVEDVDKMVVDDLDRTKPCNDNHNHDCNNGVVIEKIRDEKDDDRDIFDLITGIDQFFTVGVYWLFDE